MCNRVTGSWKLVLYILWHSCTNDPMLRQKEPILGCKCRLHTFLTWWQTQEWAHQQHRNEHINNTYNRDSKPPSAGNKMSFSVLTRNWTVIFLFARWLFVLSVTIVTANTKLKLLYISYTLESSWLTSPKSYRCDNKTSYILKHLTSKHKNNSYLNLIAKPTVIGYGCKTFWNLSKHVKIFWSLLKSFKTFQSLSKSFKTY